MAHEPNHLLLVFINILDRRGIHFCTYYFWFCTAMAEQFLQISILCSTKLKIQTLFSLWEKRLASLWVTQHNKNVAYWYSWPFIYIEIHIKWSRKVKAKWDFLLETDHTFLFPFGSFEVVSMPICHRSESPTYIGGTPEVSPDCLGWHERTHTDCSSCWQSRWKAEEDSSCHQDNFPTCCCCWFFP